MRLEELSDCTGEPVQRLREWRSLGLIGAQTDDALSREEVERVRLVQFGSRRGFTAEAIAEADRRFGGLLNNQIDFLFPHGVGYRHPLPEAAATAGLALEQARRLVEAAGISEDLLQEDVEMLKQAKHAYDVGFPEEALLELLRVHIDSLGRVAEADVRLFHFYIHERLRAAGVLGPDLVDAVRAASMQLSADDRATNDFRASEGNGEGVARGHAHASRRSGRRTSNGADPGPAPTCHCLHGFMELHPHDAEHGRCGGGPGHRALFRTGARGSRSLGGPSRRTDR